MCCTSDVIKEHCGAATIACQASQLSDTYTGIMGFRALIDFWSSSRQADDLKNEFDSMSRTILLSGIRPNHSSCLHVRCARSVEQRVRVSIVHVYNLDTDFTLNDLVV
jgi:hypothetical protein